MRPFLSSEINRIRHTFKTSFAQVLVEIWGDRDSAEENVDAGGVVVRSGETGVRKLSEVPARFWQGDEQDSEQPFADEPASAAQWTFRFNGEDHIDLQFNDEIHYDGRVWQVINPGGEESLPIQRDVRCVEVLEGLLSQEG